MAMHAGLGFSKIIFIVGAGYTGTLLMKNKSLSEVLAELQVYVKGFEKNKNSDGDASSDLSEQIRLLSLEIRQQSNNRPGPIMLVNGNSGGNYMSLVVPAATIGALGYGYMWWKGIKFSDLMYVTKHGMATAVANLTKHLDHVSEALAATKRHLTQRIENLDGKLDEQMEISKLIKNDVSNVRGDLTNIGYDVDELTRLVSGLDGKLLSLEGKQEVANAGVMYLCSIVNGKKVKMPENIQELLKLDGNVTPSLMGLKDFADFSSNGNRYLTNGISQDGVDTQTLKPRTLSRTASNK